MSYAKPLPYRRTDIRCVTCGNHIVTRSTKPEIVVDACPRCHPFWTGSMSWRKTHSQVDRFNRRYNRDV